MQLAPPIQAAWHYRWPARYLHWTLAALIPVQVGLGWYMLAIEEQPESAAYFAFHISLGLTAALLIALRLLWRLRNRPKPLPALVPTWQVRAAGWSHGALYLTMVLMPLTGFVGASLNTDPIAYFGLHLPRWAGPNDGLKEIFFTAHSILAWTLVTLVTVHILGAIKHRWITRDEVFSRMWPTKD